MDFVEMAAAAQVAIEREHVMRPGADALIERYQAGFLTLAELIEELGEHRVHCPA
jgi:hypothetical protein